jgi:two-component system sensor histidine kinase GlrK
VSKLVRVINAISRQKNALLIISTSGPKELIILDQKLHILAGHLIQSESLLMLYYDMHPMILKHP